MKKSYSKILSIKPTGKSKVYDFTVKDTHRILANNFYTSNCHVDHPDIKQFIMKKDDLTKVTGANVSVKVTDEFMKAVESNSDYILRWPINNTQPIFNEQLIYDKIYKREDGSYIMKVKAKEVWDMIVKQAHKNAEPGVLFWDNIINESPADCYSDVGFKTMGTNPCGEVVLSSHDSCRLGSINLSNIVSDPYTDKAKIDYNLLSKITRVSQRLMDDIVSLEEEKIKDIISKIESDPESIEFKQTELNLWKKVLKVLLDGRRTGLGVLGLGDMLAKLGIKYGSTDATKIVNKVFETIAVNSYKESVNLAKERGSFPAWDVDKESQNPFIIRVISNHFNTKEYEDYLKYGRRNIANLAIAPTGSLAILARTTSGIEPVFKCYYKRRRKINPNEVGVRVDYKDDMGDSWQEYNVFHPEFEKWAVANLGDSISKADEQKWHENLTDEQLDELVSRSPWAGVESHNINYLEKVNMQGVIQKWIDHSISVCLAKDTLIDTNEGLFYLDELTNFSKIPENEFKQNNKFSGKVLTHDNKRSDITSFYNNGVKVVGKITLKNGMKIKSTLNERYLKLNEETNITEWTKLSDLEVGDRIMLKNYFD